MSLTALLNPDGTSKINVAPGSRMRRRFGVVASGGDALRETRLADEATPRVYEINLAGASRAELEAVRAAVASSKGGAVPVSWRHPIDDPAGTVDNAPRFRIVNAGELAGLVVDREPSGQRGSVSLVLEQVATT